MSQDDLPPMNAEGQALFDAMVRWRALATTTILLGFGAGLANLIVTGTAGQGGLSRGLAAAAVLLIVGAVVSTLVASGKRRAFLAWYRENGPE
jgi:hypothetical protein